ncbi:hypothetical protein PIB30_030051 [Stylosanthes scabra]|uniref:Uncharacterized protein n=1 Tax=Stylosanthes scabra TaxID=79078 RepID=A0ABU6TB80_9FABA|nr:hypothetical protein [Stylosanthes scabra]
MHASVLSATTKLASEQRTHTRDAPSIINTRKQNSLYNTDDYAIADPPPGGSVLPISPPGKPNRLYNNTEDDYGPEDTPHPPRTAPLDPPGPDTLEDFGIDDRGPRTHPPVPPPGE